MYYAVVKYFNYRKDVSLEILKTFHLLEKANQYALECAEREYGDKNIQEGITQRCLELDDEVIDGYTNGNGYCQYVFTVLEIDDPKDHDKL